MKRSMMVAAGAVVIGMASVACGAEGTKVPKIADNSFLIEEAYNQEPGVIQHINAYQYNHEDHSWMYTFTEEIPVPDEKNQLSFTLPVEKVTGGGTGEGKDETGLGDVLLNYRYQLVGDDRIAIAPRFSFVLPTGDSKKGLGDNNLGYQVNLPVSIDINPLWTMHWNLGATYLDKAEDTVGNVANTLGLFYGVSAIACITPTFNLMLEVVGGTDEEVVGADETERSDWFVINPGMRFAINCKSGLQIVPGFSVPIGVGPSSGEVAMLGYLSFEHPAF